MKSKIDCTKIYVMKINFDVLDIDEQLLCNRMKIREIKSLYERKRSLFARCLLYYALNKECNVKNVEIELATGKFGKPRIVNLDGIEFNISHSGEYVCCAISSREVGVDIQLVEDIDLEISRRFFTENENSYILSDGTSSKISKFYDIWSCKESYIKMLGYGLSKPLNSFEIKINDGIYCVIDDELIEKCNLSLRDSPIDYKLAICYKTTMAEVITVQNKDVIDFISIEYLRN